MKCPRCVQLIHRTASQCPHCGFSMLDLDEQFGGQEVRMRRLSDSAGVLRLKERKKAAKWFEQFERRFPQLFFSVYYGALDERTNIRQFGMWLLNRGAFEDVDISRPNEGGVLLVIDVHSKTAFIANGYLLDFYLREKDTFNILSKAHPHLLQGNYYKALKIIMDKLSTTLKKRSRKAIKNPDKYQRLSGGSSQEMTDILEPLRPQNTQDDVSVSSVPREYAALTQKGEQ